MGKKTEGYLKKRWIVTASDKYGYFFEFPISSNEIYNSLRKLNSGDPGNRRSVARHVCDYAGREIDDNLVMRFAESVNFPARFSPSDFEPLMNNQPPALVKKYINLIALTGSVEIENIEMFDMDVF